MTRLRTFARSRTTAISIGAIAAVMSFAVKSADACDPPPPVSSLAEVLGYHSQSQLGDVALPRNVAFVTSLERTDAHVSRGVATVELESLVRQSTHTAVALWTAAGGLEPGSEYAYENERSITIGDFFDHEPPTQPLIESVAVDRPGAGCEDDCGGFTIVSIKLRPVTDDRTPREHLTYALFVGTTAQDASSARELRKLGPFRDDEVGFVLTDPLDRDLYVAVQALDFAANESAISAPRKVHEGGAGCDVFKGSYPSMLVITSTLAGLLLSARRRARAK